MIFASRLDPEKRLPVKALGVPCRAVDGWQDTVPTASLASPHRLSDATVRTQAPRSHWAQLVS